MYGKQIWCEKIDMEKEENVITSLWKLVSICEMIGSKSVLRWCIVLRLFVVKHSKSIGNYVLWWKKECDTGVRWVGTHEEIICWTIQLGSQYKKTNYECKKLDDIKNSIGFRWKYCTFSKLFKLIYFRFKFVFDWTRFQKVKLGFRLDTRLHNVATRSQYTTLHVFTTSPKQH